MNKLRIVLHKIYNDNSISVLVPISVTLSIFIIIIALVSTVAYIFNVLPHIVLLGTIAVLAIPTALYHIKKNWPKE